MAVVTNQKASFDANTNADLEVATRTKTGGTESGELLQRVIPSANDGSTLDVATEATLTALNATLDNIRDTIVGTGASSQQIQGSVAVGASISGKNPVPIAFQDVLGNALIPTGLNAGGVNVLGVLPVDAALHLQDFAATGEAYSLIAATANSSATARYLACDANGNLYGRPAAATTATRTQVADSATDVAILASNTSRRGGFIFNDSSALLYLAYGTTAATSTNYSFRVYPNGYHQIAEGYTGEIRGIWATDPNDGGAKVTELT